MSRICCDLCKYWISELKECGNTHIDKCVDMEHFVKSERNCCTCENEIYNEALEDFAKALLVNEVVDKSVVRRVKDQMRR